ncbi:hypothetical protein PCYB_092330 [Plasmodium cynomolgi strain B]|uniref:Uncharacterized protein n=1 Tax=Plasmodium cynomolgi (strain B) TaxID=1120755 RepID=K6VB75_PLACD|nr:hypothetical protein PCYB_092330 [Plasmodium cynomolgi strain B]GAB66447.1 hypothetical protein PCYB_092330 [Plasmodium cynomolgi strain B]
MIKMQILKGLNQRSYDPGHLERMVSSKCFPLPTEGLRHVLNRNEEVTLVGGDKNTKKKEKKKEPSGPLNWSKKWASARKIYFCSLYVEENYEMIVQIYRNEYPLSDFYLTYIYVMALLKLRRYAFCWEYLSRVNRLRVAHRAGVAGVAGGAGGAIGPLGETGATGAGLVHFLWGKLYEKLLLCRLSAAEYSKLVLNHVGKSTPSLHTRLGAHEVTATSHNGMADMQPFILVCLDKLIGTGQLKRREESMTLKFVQVNYNLGKVLNFYFCKWVINRAIIWEGNTPSNKDTLRTARRLAIRLKLIDVCPVHAFSPKGDRPICHEESITAVGKQSRYCVDHPLWSEKSIRTEKVTLQDLLHSISFCHKKFDFLNAYYLSEYTLRRENALGEEDTILLFVESITSMHSVVSTSEQKIDRLLQLYNARVNHIAWKARQYTQSEKQNYEHTKDHLDYYLHGVIALLKENYEQALLYLKKCVNVKRKFFLAYVYMLHVLCCSPMRNAFNLREKKKFSTIVCMYCSSVLSKLQLDLNQEREKRGGDKKRKKSLLIESTTFLRDIFSKAMHLDNKNAFLYNELFVFHFLRKDFIQCQMVLRKMLLIIEDLSSPCCSSFPLSVVLYNCSVFYFLCENNLNKSAKKVIEILQNNPFDVKALNLLTFLLFLKRDQYWTCFFDYSMYVERSLLSRNVGSQRTYLCHSFFNRLRETRDLGLLARYYGALRGVRASFPFVLNYIHASYSP